MVDLDGDEASKPAQKTATPALAAPRSPLASMKARLNDLLGRYTEDHPEVKRLRRQIQEEEAKAGKDTAPASVQAASADGSAAPAPVRKAPVASAPARIGNPVLESQLRTIETEIGKHKEEQQRLTKMVGNYQAKLEAIPVREQQITDLVRDYEISKAHYKGLLEKQLSAQTATELEIRQKGERFTVLDAAQPASRPSKPNRPLLNAGGAIAGLVLGFALVLASEFVSMSITGPEQVVAVTGLPVLEVIPMITTTTGPVESTPLSLYCSRFGNGRFAVCLRGRALPLPRPVPLKRDFGWFQNADMQNARCQVCVFGTHWLRRNV